MISGIGEIICTHAVAGSFHQNRVSKKGTSEPRIEAQHEV